MKRLFKIGAERHDVGRVAFSWHPEGNFLASAGKNGVIHITDRHGDILDEIPLSVSAPVLALEWDREGECLAILQEGNGVVPIWNLSTKRVVPLETNLKDPTWLAWSKTSSQLAIGTLKGALLIYNKARKQKIPIMGKHSKRITCGGWSHKGNKLILGSEDRTITISNENGDTLLQTELKNTPTEALFTLSENHPGVQEDAIISANLSGKSLLLYNVLDEREDPLELTFATRENSSECRYGDLIQHDWYSEDLVLVGFSDGYILSVSTSAKELGEEKFSIRIHSEELINFAYNPILKKIASAGNDGIRVMDTRDFKESKQDYIPLREIENGKIIKIVWSPDGQILSVGTSAGNIYNFLAQMMVKFTAYKTSIAYLSSLREISVVDAVKKARPTDITVKLEPSLIAVGNRHIAAGMNNHVYYHRIMANSDNVPPVNDQEYVGIVKEVQLNNEYAAILTDNKAIIHLIEPNQSKSSKNKGGNNSPDGKNSSNQSKTFPNRDEGSYAKITCIAITDNFFFYGTEGGTVEMFFFAEWTLLTGIELRLNNPIKKLYPNNNGTKVIVIDGANQVFLYNPVNANTTNTQNTNAAYQVHTSNQSSLVKFEGLPMTIVQVLWDIEEKNIIMFYDGTYIHTYIYIPTCIDGSKLLKLGPVSVSNIGEIAMKPDKIEIPSGHIPLVSYKGILTCQNSQGNIMTFTHPFFDKLDVPIGNQSSNNNNNNNKSDRPASGKNSANTSINDPDLKAIIFCQALALNKLEKAWEIAIDLDKRSFFLALSHKSMELLNVELACRVYNQLGDAGMVMALKDCMEIEDRNILAGQISLLFANYQHAQELFLASSNPILALEMRKDLMQWDQALKLAQILSAIQIPDICISYGQQLEVRDNITLAMKMYEEALHALDNDGNRVILEQMIPTAMMGMARCQLRLGNIRQGIRMANELDDKQLFHDGGSILETQKQYSEAASMYVKALQYEKAAGIYTKYLIKSDKARISEAAMIMEHVNNDTLNSTFGKACAAAGKYDDALKAFKRAKDFDKVVEIQLKHLDQVQQAFDLVRTSGSSQGAQFVAEYCASQNDYRGAIEFLLIANKSEEAFKLAQTQSMMDVYTSMIGENISPEDAMKVAQYYEKSQDYGRAGRFYTVCAQYARALKLFLQCGDREIDSAIDVVGKSQNENLTHQLIDFLVGEKDGVPKDPNYIYRLYMALKKYEDAAKTAMIIARQEQDLGNYQVAHGVIYETIRCLEDARIKVSTQIRASFILLHSYLLVKAFIKRGDHLHAARLLLRIVTNVSKFPLHVIPILTSTVIECQRASLKVAAYEYAVTLVRPEYRAQIDVNLKRKIEAIVRRRGGIQPGETDVAEDVSPCPISGQMIPITALECPTTRDALPMCIISGKHMVLEDWCFCPITKFPALYSEYVQYIREETKHLDIHATGSVDTVSADGEDGNGNNTGRPLAITNGSSGTSGPEDPVTTPTTTTTTGKGVVITGMEGFLSAPDPIVGKSVTMNDLVLVSAEDALQYLQRYNNVFESKSSQKGKSGGGSGGGTGGSPTGKEKDGGESAKERGNAFDSSQEMNSPIKGSGNTGEDQEANTPMKDYNKPRSNVSSHVQAKISKAKLDRIQRSKKRKSNN